MIYILQEGVNFLLKYFEQSTKCLGGFITYRSNEQLLQMISTYILL